MENTRACVFVAKELRTSAMVAQRCSGIQKGKDKRRKESGPFNQRPPKKLSITILHVVYDSLFKNQDCTCGPHSLIQKGVKKIMRK